jgi:SecD/SecF fusion protein
VLATAGVKGFALTLGIGVIVSMITAVLATQAILLALRGHEPAQVQRGDGRGEARARWQFDFMGASSGSSPRRA